MKKMIAAALVALALIALCTVAVAETTTTVMMYMCGTDLQSDCITDMYEMCAVDLPDSVNVVVQAGGASEWDDPDLTPNALNRFQIKNGGFENMEVLARKSMGAKDTLLSFLEWAIPSFPADRYMLVLWDHGGGSDMGICFDETANGDGLIIHEVYDALYEYSLKNEGFRLDILGCDACLMATYEMAAHMAWYADYMVASEELEPGLGWNYTGWLFDLAQNPDMDTQSIGVAIADAFMEACIDYNPDSYYSQSVIYLPAMAKVVEYMERYAAYLNDALANGQIATFTRARQRMYAFGDFNDSNANNNMVDLMAFLDATRSIAPNTANLVETAYKRAVRHNVGTSNFDYLTGLSILFPYSDTKTFLQNYGDYGCTENIPNYTEFARAYATMLGGSDYNFTTQAPTQLDSELAVQSTFTGNMMNTILMPNSNYVATGDADAQADEDDEDVTADLPEVQSNLTEQAGVTIGGILPGVTLPEQESTPAADSNAAYACTITLSQDELANLGTVEGVLFMDLTDDEGIYLVDLGSMQNAYINWDTGEIVSGFDGTWALMDDQLVAMTDQIVTAGSRRSIITVKCNDVEGFLVMTFNEAHPDGVIAGFTRGADENGLPARGLTQLKAGDVITPMYSMLYSEDGGELQPETFEGSPITVGEDGTLPFMLAPLKGGEVTYRFCFRLTDIYGTQQMTEFISFML